MIKKTKLAFLLSGLFVSNAMASGFDVNVNSLHYATSINEADYVRELVQDEPNLASQFNADGLTPVHMAIKKSSLTSLAVLLEEKINPNIKNSSGETPLIYAIKNGHPKAAELLINNGAKKKIKDKAGKTAEDYAKTKGVRYLKLFSEKKIMKKTQEVDEKLITVKDFEKYQTEIKIRLLETEKINKKTIGDLELKILSISSELEAVKLDLSQTKEQNLIIKKDIVTLKDEIKGTDLSLLDLEQRVEKVSEDASLVRRSVLNVESRTDVISKTLKKYTSAQMLQMYGNLNEKEEGGAFELLGTTSESSTVKQEADEINFLEFDNSTKVEIIEKEDEINFIK